MRVRYWTAKRSGETYAQVLGVEFVGAPHQAHTARIGDVCAHVSYHFPRWQVKIGMGLDRDAPDWMVMRHFDDPTHVGPGRDEAFIWAAQEVRNRQ